MLLPRMRSLTKFQQNLKREKGAEKKKKVTKKKRKEDNGKKKKNKEKSNQKEYKSKALMGLNQQQTRK